jgi:putative ABC transport system permease protein
VTAVALVTLAIGVGANTTIFSVVNTVLLRPLPYRDSDRLVMVWQSFSSLGALHAPFSEPDLAELERRSHSFEEIAALFLDKEDYNLTGRGEPERVAGIAVSVNLFRLIGVRPALGRDFLDDEDHAGHEDIVILSQRLWQRKFGGDQALIGQSIDVDGRPHTVVGVMPPGFDFPPAIAADRFVMAGDRELWVPLVMNRPTRESHPLAVLALLKPGVTVAQANAEVQDIARQLEEQYPATNNGIGGSVSALRDLVVGQSRQALWILLGAIGFVLLIACVNIANLLLGRAAGRRREIAIRAALGASRARLARQVLAESLVLGLLGGGCGMILAPWGIELLRLIPANGVPRLAEVAIDHRVLAFTVAVSLLTSIVFGLAPAVGAARTAPNETLRDGGWIQSRASSARLRASLVVGELALALVLLGGAGLLIRSFGLLVAVDPGFDSKNVLTASIRLPSLRYKKDDQICAFTNQLVERVQLLPGVTSAATVNSLPIAGFQASTAFYIEGNPRPGSIAETPMANERVISPGYFGTMGIPLLEGRAFDGRDQANATRVAIVSHALARRFFSGVDPVGKRIEIQGDQAVLHSIVGVVGDVHHSGLGVEPEPEIYMPYQQDTWRVMSLVVRSARDPERLGAAVREQVWAIDRDQPVFNVQSMERVLAQSVAPRRFSLVLLIGFAALAMLLAAIGIYGVISYSVTQRAGEIGVRIALGASSRGILKLVIKQGAVLATSGVGLGLAGTLALSHLLSGLLFGISPTDVPTLTVVSALLLGVALVACYIPARRATTVDPTISIRYE